MADQVNSNTLGFKFADYPNPLPTFAVTTLQSPLPTQSLGARRYEALFKPIGIATNGVAFNQTAGLSSALFCTTVKAELETDADAVRLVAVNRAANAISNLKALVGVTETASMATSALLGSPTIGGVSYQALQGANDANGWRAVTWTGSATVNIPAANVTQQIALSDWTPKSTIPRTDGGTRPLALWRSFVDGSATNIAFAICYTNPLQTPSVPLRQRILQNSAAFVDAVAAPASVVSASNSSLEVYPIYRFRVPVFSVWAVGDSITQNDALVTDKVSCWAYRACLDLSTPAKPVVFANMGGSSQTATTYLAIARSYLTAGVPAPSCLIVSPASVNDVATDANAAELQASRIIEILKLCSDFKIPYLVMWPWLQVDTYNLAQDTFRKNMNAKIKAEALASGVMYIEFPATGNGASPERWVNTYQFDSIHPNELAIETLLAPTLKNVLANLI